MKTSQNANKVFEVKTFGGLTITYDNVVLSETEGHARKVWSLIGYFLFNRKSSVSQKKLVRFLWDEGEIGDPSNALKNLVYRARKALAELPLHTQECIIYKNKAYHWNNEIDTVIDAEQFEKFYKKAQSAAAPQQKMKLYMNAIALYKGEFLPKAIDIPAFVTKAEHYKSIFVDSVITVFDLLLAEDQVGDAVVLCQNALEIYPYDEQFHKSLMIAYLRAGNRTRAFDHYEFVIDLFRREFFVDISELFQDINNQIMSGANKIETDISLVKRDLRETYDQEGAFYCEYEMFRHIYRINARMVLRTGQAIHIGLITLSDIDGEIPGDEALLNDCMLQFRECITSCLRRGDTVSLYSPTQFVVLLPLTTFEDGLMVLKRIQSKFQTVCARANLKTRVCLDAIEPQ